MDKILIEICCGSADDVIQAAKAGADRVELNSGMFLGGLTPSVGSLRVAKRAGVEIMAMVRPREGGFCYSEAEFEAMLTDAEILLENGADGIVFGFLKEDGTVDVKRTEKMLQVIGGRPAVFHRAIDVTPDWRDALDALISLNVTRVLTSGQAASVHYGVQTVRSMIEHAKGRIEILPGAGIRLCNVKEIVEATGCNQVHLSMNKELRDSSTSANTLIHFGGALYPPEDRYYMTDGEKVSELVKALKTE